MFPSTVWALCIYCPLNSYRFLSTNCTHNLYTSSTRLLYYGRITFPPGQFSYLLLCLFVAPSETTEHHSKIIVLTWEIYSPVPWLIAPTEEGTDFCTLLSPPAARDKHQSRLWPSSYFSSGHS